MSNVLKVSLQITTYSLHDRGWSQRRIARELRINRGTVGRYLRLAKPAISTARRHDIEPYTYLRDVLTRLPTMTNRQIKDIVPKAWAAATGNTAPRAA
jgi:predicted transcriptional regulator